MPISSHEAVTFCPPVERIGTDCERTRDIYAILFESDLWIWLVMGFIRQKAKIARPSETGYHAVWDLHILQRNGCATQSPRMALAEEEWW